MSDDQMMNVDEELTKIKEDNQKLKGELHLWDQFYQFHSEAIVITDKELEILSINGRANKLYQQLGHVNRPRNLKDFFINISSEVVKLQVKKLIQHGYSFDKWTTVLPGADLLEIEIFAVADGKEHHEDSEKFIYMLMVRDGALLAPSVSNQNLYAELINGINHYIVIHNGQGTIVDANEAFANLLDKERYELVGKNFLEFMEKENAHSFIENLANLRLSKECRGFFYVEIEGKMTQYEYTSGYNLHSGLYYTVFAEMKELVIEEIVKQMEEAVMIVQMNGRIIYANNQVSRLLGYPRSEIVKSCVQDFIVHSEGMEPMLLETGDHSTVKSYCKWPDGRVKQLEIIKKPLNDSGCALLLCRSLEKKSEHKDHPLLHDTHRQIFDGTFDGILIWREDGAIIDVNEPATDIIGLPKETIIGCTFQDIFDLDANQKKHLQRHLSLMAKNTQHNFVCELTCKSGQTKQFDFLSRPDIMKGVHLTVFRDITDKLKMEEQLKKSDTLNVVGELAAGIAHEIRNPMTALKGFIQLLEGSVKGEYDSYFQVISSELQRIETIITDFLILAKPQAISYQVKQVNTVLSETLDLMSAQAAMNNIQFHTQYGELPLIQCEANQLKQVFINLIKNAIEAMPGGGIIEVSTESFFDNHILVSIQDHGMGIPKSVLKKLGEPFYTTKEKGTGLGLMVTYKIIEEHAGWIEVESKEGEGTLFQIYLPIIHEK